MDDENTEEPVNQEDAMGNVNSEEQDAQPSQMTLQDLSNQASGKDEESGVNDQLHTSHIKFKFLHDSSLNEHPKLSFWDECFLHSHQVKNKNVDDIEVTSDTKMS